MKARVTYSLGTDPHTITEVIEVTNLGENGAMAVLRRMYPNKIITLHDFQQIYGS